MTPRPKMDTVSWAEIGHQKVYCVAVYIYFQYMWPISDHENVTAPRPRNRVHFQSEKIRFFRFLKKTCQFLAQNGGQFLVKKRLPFPGSATQMPGRIGADGRKPRAFGSTPCVQTWRRRCAPVPWPRERLGSPKQRRQVA